MYWDEVEQTLGMFANVPRPPKRVLWSPEAFQRWIEWARNYQSKEHDGKIAPFGFVCQDEEEFYEFYS